MGRMTLWGINNYLPLFPGVVLPEGLVRDDLVSCIMDRSGMLYPYHQEPPQLKASIESWFRRRNNDFNRMYEAISAEYNPIYNYDRTETHDYSWQENGQDVLTRQASGTDTRTSQLSGRDTRTSQLSGTDTTTSTLSGSDTRTNQASGDDKNIMQSNGSDTQSQDGTTTTSVAAFDSAPFSQREQIAPDLDTTTQYGRGQTDTTTYGRKDTDTTQYGRKDTQGTDYGRKDTDSTDYGRKDTDSTEYGRKDMDTTDYGRGHTDKGELRAFGNIGVTTTEQMIEQEMELRIKYDMYLIIAQMFEDTFLCQVY